MIKVGIIGAGIRGRLHAQCLRQISGVSVVAVADPAETRSAFAAEFGVNSYPGHRDMLSAEELDAVVVASPDFAHRDAAVDVARARVHLLLEKPVAMSVLDAHAIRDAVREAGVQCMVAFENRWNPRFAVVRAQLKAGLLGEVIFQSAHLNDRRSVPTEMLSWGHRTTPGWFLMPHTVDLALWLSGRQPRTVYATGVRGELLRQGVETYDGIQALVTFDDGTSAAFQSHWVLPEAYPNVFDFRYDIVGSKGSAFLELADAGISIATDSWSWGQYQNVQAEGRVVGVTAEMARSFIGLLTGESTEAPSIDEGVLVTEVVAAIHESLATVGPVSLDRPPGVVDNE